VFVRNKIFSEPESSMKCTSCGKENPPDYKFCDACGEGLHAIENEIACPACFHLNPDDMKFCEECGARLDILTCPTCSHENPLEFKFCEECGAPLVEQTDFEVLLPVVEAVAEKKPQEKIKIKEGRSLAEQPQVALGPASPPNVVSRSRKQAGPGIASKSASVSKSRKESPRKDISKSDPRKRPRSLLRPQSLSEAVRKTRSTSGQSKQSYLRRIIIPLVTRAVVRFVVSTVTGFFLGKLGLFVSAYFK
jgi:hypothetical protein